MNHPWQRPHFIRAASSAIVKEAWGGMDEKLKNVEEQII
jgi:hypothetical protein